MIKTQIQLEEGQYDRLRAVAAQERRSLADCVRESVDLFLADHAQPANAGELDQVLGRFRPLDDADMKDHDSAWAEAILPRRVAKT